MSKFVVAALFFFGTISASFSVYAGVTTVQALDFGEWLSYNNDVEYEITVDTDGSYSFDSSGFVMIAAPQEGIYDIDGMTPNAAVSSVVAIQTLALTYSTGTFQMDVFQDSHGSNVDGDGVLRVWIGATANTTGNSVSYNDGTYSGTVQIQVNY
ncbi:MAG: DUF4402 domain-containing protein [Alphaproteobacteria bacterium]|nr:DUF4402 domain-containing protein [Alphaproteobacteria bacterium]